MHTSKNHVLIWDSGEDVPDNNSLTVLWQRSNAQITGDSISLIDLVEEDADALKKKYLAWIYELGEININNKRLIDALEIKPGLSMWWLTSLVEKCNYSKSPQVNDAIKLVKLIQLIDFEIVRKIVLVSENARLAECLRVWCCEKGIGFDWKNTQRFLAFRSLPRITYSKLPQFIQGLTWLAYYVWTRRALRGVGVAHWVRSAGRITFISYLFGLDSDAASQGVFQERYWGGLPEILKRDSVITNWLHIYVADNFLQSAKCAADQLCKLNQKSNGLQNHTTVDSFLTPSVLKVTVNDWLKIRRNGCAEHVGFLVPKLGGINIWPLFRLEWKEALVGKSALSALLYYNLFDAAWKLRKNKETAFYLQENMGWERGAISTWKFNNGGKIIGCPHSTIRFWDLRYFFDVRTYKRGTKNCMPFPDSVAVNGNAAKCEYLAGGVPPSWIIEVEALRYQYLRNIFCRKNIKSTSIASVACVSTSETKKRKLLVVGEYTQEHNNVTMKLLQDVASKLDFSLEIIVKAHPARPIGKESYPKLDFKLSLASLPNLLSSVDWVVSGPTTSASVDAYFSGTPVIIVLDQHGFNMSPLRNFPGVAFVSSPKQLLECLTSERSSLAQSIRSDDFFYFGEGMPKWVQLTENLPLLE